MKENRSQVDKLIVARTILQKLQILYQIFKTNILQQPL